MIGAACGRAIKMRFRTLNSNSCAGPVVCSGLVFLNDDIDMINDNAREGDRNSCRRARHFGGITLEWRSFETAVLVSWAHPVDLAICGSPILQVGPLRQRKP